MPPSRTASTSAWTGPASATRSGRARLDTKTRKHDFRVSVEVSMKNLTISLPDDIYARLRVDAAKAGKSMSRYVTDHLTRTDAGAGAATAALTEFWEGPGYPGIGAAWDGRGSLYAEREADLLRRHESADLRAGQPGGGKAGARRRGPERGSP
jgi:hypothetical protein